MFSGQEIVSQEECKIVLADFYEGVDCYNKTDNTIKFTLKDWALATYDSSTKTLHTPNFSCRPLIVVEPITMIFEAEIPSGTTGLEVEMHTGEYQRIRIMPLNYLRECNSWYPYIYDTPYIKDACYTATNTTLTILGKIDSTTASSITITGYLGLDLVTIEFYDDNDQLMTINPTFTKAVQDITEWQYNSVTQSYEEVTTQKEVVLISLEIAKSMTTITDSYTYNYALYPCDWGNDPYPPGLFGNISDFCNLTNPIYETRITADTATHETMSDGWFKIGVTEFRLLPTTKLKRLDGLVYYFEGAKQIEFRTHAIGIYDIYPCWDDPWSFFWLEAVEYFIDIQLWLELQIAGNYTINGNCIKDTLTNDEYCFYEDKSGTPVPIDISLTSIVAGDCHTYYRYNGGARQEVFSRGQPVSSNPRIIWSQAKCKFIVTCESIGSLPCAPCLKCTNEPDGESVHIQTDTTEPVCKASKTAVFGCQANTNCAIGEYPTIPFIVGAPTPTTTTVEHIYFSGSSMYMILDGFSTTYPIFIGNLSSGITVNNVEDNATEDSFAVLFTPFLYLHVFKFPYKYVVSDGLDDELWWDMDIWQPSWEEPSEIQTQLEGITSAGGFDFKIELSKLVSLLPDEWKSDFNWSYACAWIKAISSKRFNSVDAIFDISNVNDLDDIVCEDGTKNRWYTSNLPLRYGIPTPSAAAGVYQEEYDEYCKTVKLLVSPEAESYAYYSFIYKKEL